MRSWLVEVKSTSRVVSEVSVSQAAGDPGRHRAGVFETPSGQVVIRNGNGGELRWLRGMHKAVHGLGAEIFKVVVASMGNS
jgi:hypothetical protein